MKVQVVMDDTSGEIREEHVLEFDEKDVQAAIVEHARKTLMPARRGKIWEVTVDEKQLVSAKAVCKMVPKPGK